MNYRRQYVSLERLTYICFSLDANTVAEFGRVSGHLVEDWATSMNSKVSPLTNRLSVPRKVNFSSQRIGSAVSAGHKPTTSFLSQATRENLREWTV